jgi:hypothetical protein
MTAAGPRFLASRCPSCGAAKSRPAATAYVYCDFCGALADYDFRKACELPQQLPGPAYERLMSALQPQAEAALAAGDRSRHLEVQRKLFDAWVTACPNAVPPRCGDPAFRRAYVEYLAAGATFAAFDPQVRELAAATLRATTALKWITRGKRTIVDADGFATLLDAVLAQVEHVPADPAAAGLPPSPDGAPLHLLRRMTHALFVQGWLPYLDEKSARDLLARTGLAQEYVTAQAADGMPTTCGHCKTTVTVLAEAHHAVCEGCGHRLRVDRRLDCDGCGHDFLLDDDALDDRGAGECPFCRRRIERIGIPWTMPSADG